MRCYACLCYTSAFLWIEETVGVLAVRIFDEHWHAFFVFGEQIATDAAAVDLLAPPEQTFHFEHLVPMLVDESAVVLQRMAGFRRFLEKVFESFQASAHIVHEEAVERGVVLEHRDELRRKANPVSDAFDERAFPIRFLGGCVEERTSRAR